jgi:hypothetical protein
MAVEIKQIRPGDSPPCAAGTVIVREVGPGHGEVVFINREGPVAIYSSHLARGDDFEQATAWALSWAAHRRIGEIYVESRREQSPSRAA